MNWIRHHREMLWETIFLIALFFVSQLPLRDFDIWFHIKSGELFVKQGYLSTIETFSYAASGREWTTFEWLFQIVAYYVSTIGLWAIPPFISIFVVIGYSFLLRILGNIYKVPLLPRLVLAFAFWVSTYEFNTARPHTIAYSFLIIELYIMLSRIYNGKKWLWMTPILTLIWSNVHSTGFLSWGFFLAFGLTGLILHRKFAKEFLFFSVVNAAMTLLPPMGIADYKLLWRFFREREFLGYFIAEWGPPSDNPFGFRIYTVSAIITLGATVISAIRSRTLVPSFLTLPFVVMIIVGYTATRNIYLGTLGMAILFGRSIAGLPYKNWFMFMSITVFITFYTWVYFLKYDSVYANRLYYPLQATEFIRTYELKGNMFNDYNYGAYMLWRLAPDYRVFIDGRADVYECCEMRDYLLLAYNKKMDDASYRAFLKTFWDKHNMSYAVIVTTKHNVMRRIATLLNTDTEWALVFWDDDSQIFIRKDGNNDDVIARYTASSATPYLRIPYISGQEKTAMAEYQRMDAIAKSARTSNAIGFLLLKENRFEEAKTRFLEARELDPTFESPYMNLAELAAKDGNIGEAISLYFKAQKRAFDRGLIYIRLGQLILQQTGDRERVKTIWENGVKYAVDEDARTKLKELLSTL